MSPLLPTYTNTYDPNVVLCTNVGKAVSMTCIPCPEAGNQLEVAYERKMTEEGPTYRNIQNDRVECGDCGKDMAAGFLEAHHMIQYGKEKADKWSWAEASTEGGEPHTYQIEFPTKGGTREFPVEGCPGKAGTRTAMRVHFWRRHVWDIVIILEEGNLPHTRCSRCDMLVPWRSFNGRHKSTAMCSSGAERKRRRLAETEIQESTEVAFEVYRKQLKTVPSFKYLGRILTAGGDDWPAVAGNLGKARKSWGRLKRILSREGADKRLSGNFSRRWSNRYCCLGRRRWC